MWVRWSLPFGPTSPQAGGKDVQTHTLLKLQTKPAQQKYLLLQRLHCYEKPGTAAALGSSGLHLKAPRTTRTDTATWMHQLTYPNCSLGPGMGNLSFHLSQQSPPLHALLLMVHSQLQLSAAEVVGKGGLQQGEPEQRHPQRMKP